MQQPDFAALTEAVRAGRDGAMLALWESVRRFVALKARKWVGPRAEFDDLMQAGFLGVLDAAERFTGEEAEHSFLSLLEFKLKNRFSEVCGVRSSRRDCILNSMTIDECAYDDGPPLVELVVDPGGELPFGDIEYWDFLEYVRGIIAAALDKLPPHQAEVIRQHYLKGLTLEQAAEHCGIPGGRQAAGDFEQRGLYRLQACKFTRELMQCLKEFDEISAERDEFYTARRPTETKTILGG